MQKFSRLLLSLLLIFSISLSAMADCRPDYEKEVSARVEKLDKAKKIGRIITATSMGGMTVFWGVMGVLLVGPAGVLIGAQFGLITGVVGLPFYIRNKIKKARLNDLAQGLVMVNSAIKLAQGEVLNADETEPLQRLLNKVKKKRPDLTLESLSTTIVALNNSRALCDGKVNGKKYPATFKQTGRWINKAIR